MTKENKTTIKVSREMSDKVFSKITGCQIIGWLSFFLGIVCTLTGLFSDEMSIVIGGLPILGIAIFFSFLTGHFKALYPITKNAENQIGIDNEKYSFVRDTTEDVSK